jgi:hypothetical protein
MKNDKEPREGRRSILGWVAAAALAPLALVAGKAFAKIAKKKLKYQDKPNKGQRCHDCTQFQPGKTADARGTCKLVEGSISPNGWCLEWEAPPKK